jgi:hypothetical protein
MRTYNLHYYTIVLINICRHVCTCTHMCTYMYYMYVHVCIHLRIILNSTFIILNFTQDYILYTCGTPQHVHTCICAHVLHGDYMYVPSVVHV